MRGVVVPERAELTERGCRELAGGVGPDDNLARSTLRPIKQFAGSRRMIYLPTHDPESAVRLAIRAYVTDGVTP